MLTTARVPDGPPWAAGVIGHAWSPDLRTWQVHPPLTGPSGSGQPEVPQVVATGPSHLLLFSFVPHGLRHGGPARRVRTYFAPSRGPLGPYAIDRAVPVGPDATFAGRPIRDRRGRLHRVAFVNRGPGGFVGEVADPVPLDQLLPCERDGHARTAGRGT